MTILLLNNYFPTEYSVLIVKLKGDWAKTPCFIVLKSILYKNEFSVFNYIKSVDIKENIGGKEFLDPTFKVQKIWRVALWPHFWTNTFN